MESEPPDRTSEEFSVRLSWPTPPELSDEEPDEPDEAPAPPAPAPTPAPVVARPKPRAASVRTGARVRVTPSAASSSRTVPTAPSPRATIDAEPAGAAPTGRAPSRTPADGPATPPPAPAARSAAPAAAPAPPARPAATPAPARPTVAPRTPSGPSAASAAVAAAASVPEGSMARAFVDAFDRLADRLLDRLRTLRQDVDADLNGLRSEVALLRQAVEDAGQSVQLRQVHSALDEARNDLAGLRRAVLEWPELERLTEEVAAMRGDLSLLFDAAGDGAGAAAPSALLGDLEDVISRLSHEVGRVGEGNDGAQVAWLVDEVASVRTDLAEVLRRSTAPVRLAPDQLALVAEAVTARLLEELEAGTRRPKRR